MPNRQEALRILLENTRSPSYLRHAIAVEAAMAWYANSYGKDEAETELWLMAGILHDFDYEQNPLPTAPQGHPYVGNKILKSLGFPASVLDAIMAHAPYTRVPRETEMAKVLYAVVEVVDLVIATAASTGKPLKNLTARDVTQKFDDKNFLPNCSRDQIRTGHAELGLSLEEHFDNVIEALQPVADKLGFENTGGTDSGPLSGKYRVGG